MNTFAETEALISESNYEYYGTGADLWFKQTNDL